MTSNKLSDPSLLSTTYLPPAPRALVFFIPGNPGCIGYYSRFLSLMSSNLRAAFAQTHSSQPKSPYEPLQPNPPTSQNPKAVAVCATSLANFGPTPTAPSPFSLEGQIEFVEAQLLDVVMATSGTIDRLPGKFDPQRNLNNTARLDVILVGHSVGAYIAMEVLRRWRERLDGAAVSDGRGLNDSIRIIGMIGLWPTLTFLAESNSGQRLGWLILRDSTAQWAARVAKLSSFLIPAYFLRLIVGLVTGFPAEAAATTAKFLSQAYSVEQALYLAKHELREIEADRWTEDLWRGVFASPNDKWRSSIMLYFGKNDHWVKDEVRDALIGTRGSSSGASEEGRARMEIDQTGVPHSFCIRDSEMAAKKTAEWVAQILSRLEENAGGKASE